VNEKDMEIQDLKKNMRSTVTTELTAEKEEYYLEVGTLMRAPYIMHLPIS
jgi:hypothetical protein